MSSFYNLISFISILPLIYDGIEPLTNTALGVYNRECPLTLLNRYAIVVSSILTINTPLNVLTSTYISDFLTCLTLRVLSDNSLIFLYLIMRTILQLHDTEAMYVNMLIIALNLYTETKIIWILASLLFYDSIFKVSDSLFFNNIKRITLNLHIFLLCKLIWRLYNCNNVVGTDINMINYSFVFTLIGILYYLIYSNTSITNKPIATNTLHFMIVCVYAYYVSNVFFSTVGKQFWGWFKYVDKPLYSILQDFNKDIFYIGHNEKIHILMNMEIIYYFAHTLKDIYEKQYSLIFHHIVSIILLKLVDTYSIHNIAIAICFLYSITNPLLSLSKLLHKSSAKRLSIIPMSLFAVVFTLSRVISGGYILVITIMQVYTMFNLTLLIVILLYSILYVMQIIWLRKIRNVILNFHKI